MSTNTNGIATQANLYSLNSEAFPNWSGGLKCPTKSEILSGVNSNFTATITNNNNYSDNQLVKYSDITVNYNNTQDIDLTISVSYQPTDSNDKAGRQAQLTINEVGSTLKQFITCYNNAANTNNVYHYTLTLKKNIPYVFHLEPISSVLLTGVYDIGGVIGQLNESKTGTPSWSIGETPKGTIDIS